MSFNTMFYLKPHLCKILSFQNAITIKTTDEVFYILSYQVFEICMYILYTYRFYV